MAKSRKRTKTKTKAKTKAKTKPTKKKEQLPYDEWQECLDVILNFEYEVGDQRQFIERLIHPQMTIYRNRLIKLSEMIQVNLEVMPYSPDQKKHLLDFMMAAQMNAAIIPGEMTQEEMDGYESNVKFLQSMQVRFSNLMSQHSEQALRNKRFYRRRRFHIDHFLAIKQLTPIEDEIPEGYNTKSMEFDEFLTDLYNKCLKLPEGERIKMPWLFEEEKCRRLLNGKFLERHGAWEYSIENSGESDDDDSDDEFQNELIKFRLKTLKNILETGDMDLLLELEPTFVNEFDIQQEDIEKQIAFDDRTLQHLIHYYKCYGREIILADPSNALVESYDLEFTVFKMKQSIIQWGQFTIRDNEQLQVWIDRFEKEIPSEKSDVDRFIYLMSLLVSNALIDQMIKVDMESLTDDLDLDFF